MSQPSRTLYRLDTDALSKPKQLLNSHSPVRKTPQPADSSDFLTALAAQERRVLELKEELQKAESELDNLKRHWAQQETTRKRNELRQSQKLEPLRTSLEELHSLTDHPSSEAALIVKDSDRTKLASVREKPPQRKVFSGSRHARTLSLLSPTGPVMQRADPRLSEFPKQSLASGTRLNSVAQTEPLVEEAGQENQNQDILETGKQIVGGFRNGLRTFFEDLRQATVGEEAMSETDTRHLAVSTPMALRNDNGSSSQSTGYAQLSRDSVNSSARKHKISEGPQARGKDGEESLGEQPPPPLDASSTKRTAESTQSQQSHGDINELDGNTWDDWDTFPTRSSVLRFSSSTDTTDSAASPQTERSSRRTSMR